MSNLQPYKPVGPFSAGARFLRGFTRIGTIAAILTTLIVLPASVIFAVSNYNTAKTTFGTILRWHGHRGGVGAVDATEKTKI